MIGLRAWIEIEGVQFGGVIVAEGQCCAGPTWIVKLDTPLRCEAGCIHAHAAPLKQDTILES